MNTSTQQSLFARRTGRVPESFIREILKVTSNPDMVSFAGGLPNPSLFPVRELERCAAKVFQQYGGKVLQYAETEGLYPLRKYIAERYKKRHNLNISPEQILITNGSQQALDLICKLFIDPGDKVLVERPAYLGALQCFAMFEADLVEVSLEEDGTNTHELQTALSSENIKLYYGVPNFQNPTGISYSSQKRKNVAQILSASSTVLIEDDPYGEIAFMDEVAEPIYKYLPGQTILLGSFSKIIAPGLRLGWMVASAEVIKKATVLKQASDLHSGNLAQYILYEFLSTNNLDKHIDGIRNKYQQQRDLMLDALHHCFPFSVSYTRPQGGMFCWLRLPPGITARGLLHKSMKKNIIFVPGDTFYASNPDAQTLRLNFSNLDPERAMDALKMLGGMI